MNGLTGMLLLIGAMMVTVKAAPTFPGLTDSSGRRIIIHTSEEGIPEDDNSGSKDEEEIDFDVEDPQDDDYSGKIDNSGDASGDAESTVGPTTTVQPQGSSTADSTTQSEGTIKAEVTTLAAEVTSKYETTAGLETTAEPEPTKPSGPFKCPQEYSGAALFPDPEDCHFFYQCAHIGDEKNEQSWRKACPTDLVFDPLHKICDWSDKHPDLC